MAVREHMGVYCVNFFYYLFILIGTSSHTVNYLSIQQGGIIILFCA